MEPTIEELSSKISEMQKAMKFQNERIEHLEGAVNILYKRELDDSGDPDKLRAEKVEEFRERFANPFVAAGRGYVNEVIQPRATRSKLISALRSLAGKRATNPPKKHGNIPL